MAPSSRRNGISCSRARTTRTNCRGTRARSRASSGFEGASGPYKAFTPNVDYRLAGNRLVWTQAAMRPRDLSRVDVEYTYRERPSGLTDFNEGSVAGTLIRAVAREMKVVYEQMDQAYRRAFIDIATGAALDNVVALLGVTRNPAVPARGPVTYLRRTATNRDVLVDTGQRVAAPGGRTFVTLGPARDPGRARRVRRPRRGRAAHDGPDREARRDLAARGESEPTAPLETVPTAKDKRFGEDERTITLGPAPPSGELRVRYQPKSVTVVAEALGPGRRATWTPARSPSCRRRPPGSTASSTRPRCTAAARPSRTTSCASAPSTRSSAPATPRSTPCGSPCSTSMASTRWRSSTTPPTRRSRSARCGCATRPRAISMRSSTTSNAPWRRRVRPASAWSPI